MERLVSIIGDLRGDSYLRLISYAAARGSLFSLVWRDGATFAESAYAIDLELEADRAQSTITDSWPGTTLTTSKATVNLYRMTPSAIAILLRARGVFDWLEPHLPEDLAFYSADRAPWFGSIAHEQDAFLYADAVDLRAVQLAIPALRVDAGQQGVATDGASPRR